MAPDTLPRSASPAIEELPNGMRAILVPSDTNSIVSIACFLPLAGAIERPEECGLASFMGRMLVRGTARRNNAELAEAIDGLGISISCGANDDFTSASLVCTADTLDESLPLFAEVLQQPSFEPDEIEKERQTTIASIRVSEDDKFTYTNRHFARSLYGGHPYGFPRSGLVETVGEFRRSQLAGMHAEFFRPRGYLLACVGNFDPAMLRERLAAHFDASGGVPEPYTAPPVEWGAATRIGLARDCEQAFLIAGMPACPVDSPDVFAVRVLNTILGEGMSSRLFVRLRDERGLAYATGSMFVPHRHAGHIAGYIGTKPESLDTARENMLAEFRRLCDEAVPEDELQRARNYCVGKFLIDHQTNLRRAHYLGYYEMMGLGMGMDEDYPRHILAVTADQVREAANRYLSADPIVAELLPTAAAGGGPSAG